MSDLVGNPKDRFSLDAADRYFVRCVNFVAGIFWCVGCARTEGYYKQSMKEKA